MNFNKIKLHNIRKTLLRSTAAALCAVTISASAALSVSAATASTAATNAATSAVNGTVQSTTGTTDTTGNSQGSSDNQWPASPTISAGSAILIDADTGAILYEKDCHSRAYPASTTKIMTSLLAIENSSLDDVITFSKAAANSYKWDEANTGTREGEQFTMEQALYATLLKSANEVAYGIGEYIAGSIPAFSDMMNERARELGALNTHFNNPNGLSDTNHYTTAYDLAMIGRACFNNSTFMTISSSVNYSIPPTNKTAETRYFRQRHGMANSNGYQYEYFKGGKTGFTDESGYTLITFAQKDDMRLICVVFRESDDASRYVDSKALFDYGFNNFKKAPISRAPTTTIPKCLATPGYHSPWIRLMWIFLRVPQLLILIYPSPRTAKHLIITTTSRQMFHSTTAVTKSEQPHFSLQLRSPTPKIPISLTFKRVLLL